MIEVERIQDLHADRKARILNRSMTDVSGLYLEMREYVMRVKEEGDAYLTAHHQEEYGVEIGPKDLVVGRAEIEAAYARVRPGVVDALKRAADNIRTFHAAQMERDMWMMEVSPGVVAGRMTRPLDAVGCYVPGGRAAYPSSLLMSVIPAKAAGVGRVAVTSPPWRGRSIFPEVLVAADLAGADAVYKLGGPWAVAALAYGTDTVPRVDKIVGPGNRYVTAAKMVVFGQVDIDSPAGPSEGLILADDTADPDWLAIDFFTQLEHDPDAASVLVTTDPKLAAETTRRINKLFQEIPRQEIVQPALENHSAVLVADSWDQAFDFVNQYAAEHLQIITRDPWAALPRIRHAGSIFLGPHAPIPVGDYASGTNHILPTGRAARMFSGLSVDDFLKKSSFQYLSREGLASLQSAVTTLADAEGLPTHAAAVRKRFE